MGSQDVELSMCFSCYRMEWDWRACYADDYTCAKCQDLTSFDFQRNAFIKMYNHLTGELRHPLSLPSLFEYLYPASLSYKHTRIQQQQQRFVAFCWALPMQLTTFTICTFNCRSKLGGATHEEERPTINKVGMKRRTS